MNDAINSLGDLAEEETKKAYLAQGHNLTGKGAASIKSVWLTRGTDVVIQVLAADYVNITNRGVTAARIPYTQGSGATRSAFITGLQRYAELRFGVSSSDALRIAFQIARKAKANGGGLPSQSSQRFSSTGKRTGFVNDAIREVASKGREHVMQFIFNKVKEKNIQGR